MTPALITFLLLALQAPVAPRFPLQGRVLRSDSNEPVSKASVVVARIGGTLEDYRTGITDESGRFAFADVTPGTYHVFATRNGYLRAEYGQGVLGGGRLTIGEDQPRADIVLAMIPAGVISGRVRDSAGAPLRHVWMRAFRADYRSGERRMELVGFGQTNDLGEYRVFDLPPGQYFMSATLDQPRIEGDRYVAPSIPLQISESDRGYRFSISTPAASALAEGLVSAAAFARHTFFPIYYPNTRNETEATSLELRPGATIPGIDFMLAPTPTVHVRGRVISSVTGQPVSAYVGLAPLLGVRTGDAGSFEIVRVPPGRYELWASVDAVKLQAYAAIEVGDRDLQDITLIGRPVPPLPGRLTVDGKAPPANARFTVSLISPPGRGGVGGALVGPDGAFTLADVGPGDYRLRVSGQNGYLKTARFGAADVSNMPIHIEQDLRGQRLEIEMTMKTAVVDLVVVNDNQQPVRGVPVALLPNLPRRNRSDLYEVGMSDARGRVRIEGVAPGDYKVFASESIDAWTWRDPALLRNYESRSTPIRVVENSNQELTVKVIPSRP